MANSSHSLNKKVRSRKAEHENAGAGEVTTPSSIRKEIVFGVIAVIVTVGLGVAAVIYRDTIMSRAAGYSLFGVVIISFLAGSVLSFTAVPVPYWFLVFTLPAALATRWGLWAPIFVGLTSAVGATLGHMPTFMIGFGGRSLSAKISQRFNNRYYQKANSWAKKHGDLAVFLTSAIFNPIHLPLTVAFGTLRYPPAKFFAYSLLGNILKSFLLAFAGYYGLNSLLKLFEL